jgi:hypothetical protein
MIPKFEVTLIHDQQVGSGPPSLNEPRPAEIFMIQALTGLAAGAIATLVVGFIKHSIDQDKASKG